MDDNGSEWTMDRLRDAILIDTIRMRYEWLYQFGNFGIPLADIEESVKRLQEIERKLHGQSNRRTT